MQSNFSYPDKVTIVDVGPRDGLQTEPEILPVETKVELIRRLVDCGLTEMEVTSFVNPKRVPQMAGAEELLAALGTSDKCTFVALVPNLKGYERAAACGVKKVRLVAAVGETLNRKNFNMSVDESVAEQVGVAQRALHDGIVPEAVIAAVFGDPFDGPTVATAKALEIAKKFADAGVREFSLTDATGFGEPRAVCKIFGAMVESLPDSNIGAHFHNTRNTGYANVITALQAGVTKFDSSIGGIGGCPFAPGATGNIATEDTVHMLEGMGIQTGLDLDKLIETTKWLSDTLGKPVPGTMAKAGRVARRIAV